jgi:hypothetical protein
MRIGVPEILILLLFPIGYTWLVFFVGRKVGYGKALEDVAQGKYPHLTGKL